MKRRKCLKEYQKKKEKKTLSNGPEVFIPVIIHPLISVRKKGKVQLRGNGRAVKDTGVGRGSVGLFDWYY